MEKAPTTSKFYGSRTSWVLLFILFALAETAWSLCVPLFSGPDEPTQVVKAAAVSHLQFLGDPAWRGNTPFIKVRVANSFATSTGIPDCLISDSRANGSCEPHFPLSKTKDPSKLTTTASYVGRYPPLYYLVVGIPSLFGTGAGSVYGMRLISGLLSAFFLAWAVWLALLRPTRRARYLALAGVFAAATPSVLYFGAVVNPNGLEISSALCAFASLMVLATSPVEKKATTPLVIATVSSVVFVTARGLSPLWMAICLVSIFGIAYRGRTKQILSTTGGRASAAVVGIATLASLAWIWVAKTLEVGGMPDPHQTWPVRLENSISKIPVLLHEMVGVFGWVDLSGTSLARDFTAPPVAFFGWGICVALAVLVGLRTHLRYALIFLIGCTLLLPALIESVQAKNVGFVWQGRYSLPLAVGIPCLIGFGIAGSIPETRRRSTKRTAAHGEKRGKHLPKKSRTLRYVHRRPRQLAGNGNWLVFASLSVLATLALCQMATFYYALHEYSYGRTNALAPWWSWPTSSSVHIATWSPPLGHGIWIVAFAAAIVGIGVVAATSAAGRVAMEAPSPSVDPSIRGEIAVVGATAE